MSTMNSGSMLSLDKDSKRLSLVKSITSLNQEVEIEYEMGVKSESEAKMASEAKQKKIDQFVIHAEKVSYSRIIPPQNKELAR